MKLALFTVLAIKAAASAVVVEDDAGGVRGMIPKLLDLSAASTSNRADQLIDVDEHCDGCQPDYCYEDPNFDCYKNGFPKCCTKQKGNCPNNNLPQCECNGSCDGSGGGQNRFDRCSDDRDCASDEYCLFNSGTCGDRNDGICEVMPRSNECDNNNNPVCGCDDRDYRNRCRAAVAGVSIKYTGECDDNGNDRNLDRCSNDRDCLSDEYCLFNSGTCGDRGDGVCAEVKRNNDCDNNNDPVCGCDNNDYRNRCRAAVAGVSIKYTGECDDNGNDRNLDRCSNDRDCLSDEYCLFNSGTCGDRGDGVCADVKRNNDCDNNNDPVCGCDNNDYRNRCRAAVAGVSIKYTGRC